MKKEALHETIVPFLLVVNHRYILQGVLYWLLAIHSRSFRYFKTTMPLVVVSNSAAVWSTHCLSNPVHMVYGMHRLPFLRCPGNHSCLALQSSITQLTDRYGSKKLGLFVGVCVLGILWRKGGKLSRKVLEGCAPPILKTFIYLAIDQRALLHKLRSEIYIQRQHTCNVAAYIRWLQTAWQTHLCA